MISSCLYRERSCFYKREKHGPYRTNKYIWILSATFRNVLYTRQLGNCVITMRSDPPPPPHSVLFKVRICVFQPTPLLFFSKSPVCKVNTARPFSFVYEPFSAPPPPPLFSKSPVCKVNTGRPFSFVTKRTFWQHAWGPSVLGVGGGGDQTVFTRTRGCYSDLLWRVISKNDIAYANYYLNPP